MSDTILTFLAERNEKLKNRLAENAQLSSTWVALIMNVRVLSIRKRRSVARVDFEDVSIVDYPYPHLKAHLRFRGSADREVEAESRREFTDYGGRKAELCARAMRKNPRLTKLLERVCESLGNYAGVNSIPFGAVKIEGAVIDKTDVLFFKLSR